MLLEAVVNGLAADGVAEIADFGLATTPAMFMSTVTEGHLYDGAIMLTASHLPFNRNGMKFFTASGGTDKRDIRGLVEEAAEISSTAQGRI